jgi:hypothetical protein
MPLTIIILLVYALNTTLRTQAQLQDTHGCLAARHYAAG